MDGERFDLWVKRLAAGTSRRTVVKGLAGGLVAGVATLLGRQESDARRVTQAYCGNAVCADDPSVCRDGCECCIFGNGNSRCMPPKDCQRYGGAPAGGSVPYQGTCLDGMNICTNTSGTALCDGTEMCGCLPTVGGHTVCGDGPSAQCSPCLSDSDCVELMGEGSACVLQDSPCGPCQQGEGDHFCIAPCSNSGG